jgi:two-component system cell cycle sensor histidine kinase/response regulator CckA
MLPHTGNETILIVDDEIIVLNLAAEMLARFGYKVLRASNPHEALDLISVQPDLRLDLLLVDIILPGMNGLVLADRIRELRANVPVLFMSGYSERYLLDKILVRKISYLAKPFTSLQLTRTIREVLNGHQNVNALPRSEA